MGVATEGFQRAIGKPFGRLHRGDPPATKPIKQFRPERLRHLTLLAITSSNTEKEISKQGFHMSKFITPVDAVIFSLGM